MQLILQVNILSYVVCLNFSDISLLPSVVVEVQNCMSVFWASMLKDFRN